MRLFAVIPVGIGGAATDKTQRVALSPNLFFMFTKNGGRVCAFCARIAAIFKVKVAECVPYARVDNSARTTPLEISRV